MPTETQTPPPPADGRPADERPADQKPADRNRFFSWLRGLGLTRQPGWIGGVATGIADRLGIDPLIVRGILVVVAIVGAPATLLYAIAWALLPDAKGKIHLEELIRGRFDTPMIGIAVLLAVSLLPVPQGIWSLGAAYWGQPYWGDSIGRAIWTLVLIGLVVWLMVWFIRRSNRAQTTFSAASTTPTDAQGGSTPPAADPAAASPLAFTGTILGTPGTETTGRATTGTATPGTDTPTGPVTAPIAPPRPPEGASTEELAAWRDSQAQWKLQYDAFRDQRSAERQAASAAASAQARAERIARTAIYREQRARTRSNPIYSVVLIGVGLIGGAITTLALGGSEPSVVQYLTGLGVAIGILAVGIIVNGIRGKRAGGASAVAVLLAIPLLFAAVFPQSDRLHYSGDWKISTTLSQGGDYQRYVQGFGTTTIDLTHYFDGTSSNSSNGIYGSVDLFVASGNVTVILPPADGGPDADTIGINVDTGNGSVTTDSGVSEPGPGRHSWGVSTATADSLNDDSQTPRQLGVSVVAGAGNITVINAPQTSE